MARPTRCRVLHRKLFETGRLAGARFELLPTDEHLRGWQRDDVTAQRGVAVARVELSAHLARLFLDLLALGDEQLHPPGGAQELDHRNRVRLVVKPLP